MIGNLAQQIGAISVTAGIGGAAIEPIAAKLGFLARGMTPMAIRAAQVGSESVLPKVAGEAIRKTVTSAASAGMVGALYQGISTSVEQGKGMIDNNQYPDLLKIGTSMAKGLGWAVYGSGGAFTGNLMGISAASATVGGTAYMMSKMDGASESDARLNGITMTAFTAITHGNFTFEARKKLVSDLQDTFAGYTKAKNPDTEQNNIHQLVGNELVGKVAKEVLNDRIQAQIKENPENIEYQKQLQSLENEGGNYAIGEITKTQADTEELVKRIAEQTFGTSKIGKSIETKSKDQGFTEGFEKTAQYRPTTFEEQENLANKAIKNIDDARAMIRGEKELPKNLEGVALIDKMEDYLKKHPDQEIAYELANSPLVTETSEQARGLSIARMREQDSYAKAISELREKKIAMSKEAAKDIPKRAKEEMNKVNLSKEDLDLDKFLDGIKC